MTALAMTNFAPPAQPDLAKFVPIGRAAMLLGQERGHLTRICRDKLYHQGLAVQARPSDGGQVQWFISRRHDPRLIDGEHGALWQAPDLEGFTQKQRDGALARRACVESLRHARQTWPGFAAEWMPRLIEQLRTRHGFKKLSASALYRWDFLYRRPSDLMKLIDSRGGDNRGRTDDAAWEAFKDLYLNENQPSARQVWKQVGAMAKENGWTWCSYKGCVGQLDRRISPEQQLKHRQPAKWRQTLRPFIAQDPESWAAGECWIGDHKQLDLICRFNDQLIRPWLTTWMDWRTRRIAGWTLNATPNSTAILGALRHGLMDELNQGGPRSVWIDNGKDYDCWMFHGQTKKQRRTRIKIELSQPRTFGIFNAVQIEPHFSIPFNPNGKGRLERWFRTLADFFRVFDTYTGDGPDTKPEKLAEILKSPHRIPALDQIEARIGAHIDGYNACNEHGRRDLQGEETGELLSPNEAMAQWCSTRHVMRDPKSLNLLLMQWHRPVTVGRNGIALSLRGRTVHYGQFDPALSPFKAAKKEDRRSVIVAYDPHDIRSIRVHDEQFRYVCTAEMNQLGGLHGGDAISLEHVAQLNRSKAQYAQSIKHVQEHSLTQCLTAEEALAETASYKPPTPQAQPAALRIIQTPIDGQAAAIEREQLKAAVGTEGRAVARRPSVFDKLRNIAPAREMANRDERPDPWAKARLLQQQEETANV
jgi:transposase InsO family protein